MVSKPSQDHLGHLLLGFCYRNRTTWATLQMSCLWRDGFVKSPTLDEVWPGNMFISGAVITL